MVLPSVCHNEPILIATSKPIHSASSVEASTESAKSLFDPRRRDATISYDEAGPGFAPDREARERLDFDTGIGCAANDVGNAIHRCLARESGDVQARG